MRINREPRPQGWTREILFQQDPQFEIYETAQGTLVVVTEPKSKFSNDEAVALAFENSAPYRVGFAITQGTGAEKLASRLANGLARGSTIPAENLGSYAACWVDQKTFRIEKQGEQELITIQLDGWVIMMSTETFNLFGLKSLDQLRKVLEVTVGTFQEAEKVAEMLHGTLQTKAKSTPGNITIIVFQKTSG